MENQLTSQMSEPNAVNLDKETNAIAQKIQSSPEVIALSKQLDVKDSQAILKFGQDTSQEISKFADRILHTLETTKVENSGSLLLQLNKIMDKFEIKDFKEEKQGLLGRLFNKAKKSMEDLFKKYHTMGGEIDKVYVELNNYEVEINNSNNMLQQMFDKNMEYYEAIEKYIQAGHLIVDRIKTEIIPQLEVKATEEPNQYNQMQLNNGLRSLEMMEQRLYDLELAKTVALQTMPQIKLIQQGNYNLVRKINSAFIITIPIFKNAMIQAITLKRQAIQANAMKALDDKTNELLLKNAQNIATQSKLTAELASGSSIKIETLEKTWQTIMQGIDETKRVQEDAKQKRLSGTKRMKELQAEYQNKLGGK
ncbi:toxic anion resistance protein [Clostridium sp. D2Q-11]|uniref:Toxic anion resistance protein n=1 Tax=Anaeromonas frigoriresistens TaxID=2683708 RepID=A0A942UWK1_9FIRM|nr:toxic anion resistance protein [Anaeromonas frigoriresistens]MBS4536922.1 toxic anion resistance protein [Anaeromonas frigoriresistens]